MENVDGAQVGGTGGEGFWSPPAEGILMTVTTMRNIEVRG